jgi:hypothetical protein
MRFDPSGSGFCAMVLLGLSTLACSQAGQVGEIHVEAPATKEGIRMSFKGSGAVSTSPESGTHVAGFDGC